MSGVDCLFVLALQLDYAIEKKIKTSQLAKRIIFVNSIYLILNDFQFKTENKVLNG